LSREAEGAPTVRVVDAIARILKIEGAEFLSAYPTTPVIDAAAKTDAMLGARVGGSPVPR
ncbi:MAG: hypothetical protein DMD91_27390, partial [Candidatus Rokuibacteriota bacterium]